MDEVWNRSVNIQFLFSCQDVCGKYGSLEPCSLKVACWSGMRYSGRANSLNSHFLQCPKVQCADIKDLAATKTDLCLSWPRSCTSTHCRHWSVWPADTYVCVCKGSNSPDQQVEEFDFHGWKRKPKNKKCWYKNKYEKAAFAFSHHSRPLIRKLWNVTASNRFWFEGGEQKAEEKLKGKRCGWNHCSDRLEELSWHLELQWNKTLEF